MNRRNFIKRAGGAALALTLPVPAATGASIRASVEPVWPPETDHIADAMSWGNQIISPELMVREALHVLNNNLELAEYLDSHPDAPEATRVGSTVRVRIPPTLK